MQHAYLSQRELHSLPADKFAWGCCVRSRFRFTYVYGTTGEYRLLVAHAQAGDSLYKGTCDTLEEAHTQAQERALELADTYEGLGSVRVLSAQDYLTELDRFTGGPGR